MCDSQLELVARPSVAGRARSIGGVFSSSPLASHMAIHDKGHW
jgi:hypothetical protein